jgi:gliding motility-associated protein GldC
MAYPLHFIFYILHFTFIYLCPTIILYMPLSSIVIDVHTDENKMPDTISWKATDTTVGDAQKAKAMILSFWDGAEKAALRIDLWTKDMMVDEMADFFYQTMMTMADTYGRATNHKEIVEEMKSFAHDFYNKFREKQLKENKA